MERYTAFDLELANRYPSSICAIGVCVVENNRIVDTFYSRVKPVPFISESGHYHIHQISEGKLAAAPTFDQVWAQIAPLFNDTVILAHNIQQDALALRATLDHYHLTYPNCDMSCTFVLSKKLLPNCPSYKLDGIASYFNFRFSHHHALEDAIMCYRIIRKIKSIYQLRSLDELHELIHVRYGRMADQYYKNIYMSDIASNQEMREEEGKDTNHFLFHQCICLDSIHVSYGTVIKNYITLSGGFLQEKVNINTNYLISAGRTDTNNYKRAYELMQKGQDIQIIGLTEFLQIINENTWVGS